MVILSQNWTRVGQNLSKDNLLQCFFFLSDFKPTRFFSNSFHSKNLSLCSVLTRSFSVLLQPTMVLPAGQTIECSVFPSIHLFSYSRWFDCIAFNCSKFSHQLSVFCFVCVFIQERSLSGLQSPPVPARRNQLRAAGTPSNYARVK